MEEGIVPGPSRGSTVAVLSVLVAVLSVIASLFGVWLGNNNAAQVQRENLRHSDEVAMRDFRREAYEGVVTALAQYIDDLSASASAQEGREKRAALSSDGAQLSERLSRVDIAGSRRALDLASEIEKSLSNYTTMELVGNKEQRDKAGLLFAFARARFVLQVRGELSIKD